MFATVFACVRVLAESVGQLPLHLLQSSGKAKAKATSHSLYPLLHDAPNEYQTSQEWLEWLISCLATWGNAFCQINRVRGRVVELLPIAPSAVEVKLKNHQVTYV